LRNSPDFADKLLKALDIMWPPRQPQLMYDQQTVDTQLYDSFVNNEDKTKMSAVRTAKAEELSNLNLGFKDERLKLLLPLYKARNYRKLLDEKEQAEWESFCQQKLLVSGQADNYFKRLQELAATPGITGEKQYLIEEMNLYAQSVMPLALDFLMRRSIRSYCNNFM
jgi:exodeoxyribonuclease-1